MDFQRLLLFAALAFTLMMMWQAWQHDYGPQPPVATATATNPIASSDGDTPPASFSAGTDMPATQVPPPQPFEQGDRIVVETDQFRAELDTIGGDLRQVALLAYPVHANQPDDPVVLINDQAGSDLFVVQSGLLAASGANAPNHRAHYRAEANHYRLDSASDTLTVPMVWEDESGLKVTKTYTFHRGSYLVDVGFHIDNGSSESWSGSFYRQLQRSEPTGGSAFIYTYTGGVIYSDEQKYEKIDFSEMRESNLDRSFNGGWLAMIQHYFLAAWLAEPEQQHRYYSRHPESDRYLLGMVGPQQQVAAGASADLSARLFVGPKLQDELEQIATGLELTVDYGWLTFIAKPLFWVLDGIHNLVNNWGWAIILVTVLIKLLFYKLSETSYKSMAQMRKLQPRLANLKERYGDDREKMNEAMMRIYKEEKINPLGGCLPILLQIPVFIALYWVLLESVEMRQASFILWLNDLSSPDPFFVLPLLMGATMLIQQRLNPTPLDPIQAKVMMVLPIVFTIFFAFFPAGLVLYWTANNALSIAQQWYITRHVVEA